MYLLVMVDGLWVSDIKGVLLVVIANVQAPHLHGLSAVLQRLLLQRPSLLPEVRQPLSRVKSLYPLQHLHLGV